jgi:hypothetical protein
MNRILNTQVGNTHVSSSAGARTRAESRMGSPDELALLAWLFLQREVRQDPRIDISHHHHRRVRVLATLARYAYAVIQSTSPPPRTFARHHHQLSFTHFSATNSFARQQPPYQLSSPFPELAIHLHPPSPSYTMAPSTFASAAAGSNQQNAQPRDAGSEWYVLLFICSLVKTRPFPMRSPAQTSRRTTRDTSQHVC